MRPGRQPPSRVTPNHDRSLDIERRSPLGAHELNQNCRLDVAHDDSTTTGRSPASSPRFRRLRLLRRDFGTREIRSGTQYLAVGFAACEARRDRVAGA